MFELYQIFILYGDWISFIFIMIGLRFVSNQSPKGWIIILMGHIILMLWGLHFNHLGIIVTNLVYALLYAYVATHHTDIVDKIKDTIE
jgi:hypothetical protein